MDFFFKGPLATMAAGAIGGIAFWTLIFPADVVKSRIQVCNLEGTFYSTTVNIVRKEGKLHVIYYVIIVILRFNVYCYINNCRCNSIIQRPNTYSVKNYSSHRCALSHI